MRFGFDIHGVLDARPDFFRDLMRVLVDAGAEVHILSGPPAEVCVRELFALGFGTKQYTHLFSIVDSLRAKGADMWQDERGHWWSDPYIWDREKGIYCEEKGIDIHFDDSDTYGYFFKTPFARFFSRDSARVKKTRIAGSVLPGQATGM
jgi:hypothetical protein